jgi:glycosyltransferase involved in cell wall biosynthesis
MIILAYIIFGFTLLQMLIALVNFIFREKPVHSVPSESPMVSVLIPARNEENNMGNLLGDLISQDYRNIEIVIFNDQSEDETEKIVSGFAAGDGRIRLINSPGLPDGWLGKNFACHSLSETGKGDYFLFLDADVRIERSIIGSMIYMSEKKKLSLISIFPKQVIITPGEWMTVPVMNYILLTLLPLVFVRKLMFSSLAAANGQFMFFVTAAYKALEPHRYMKDNKVEDIETARFMKRNHFGVACLTGDSSVRCRMYNGFSEAVNGFSKNMAAFFGNSLVIAFIFWIITTFGCIIIITELGIFLFSVYFAAYLATRVLVSFASEQYPGKNLLYIIPQQLSMGLIIIKAFINKYFKGYQWKGRFVK